MSKAIEKDGYYYDPPSWKVCDKAHLQSVSFTCPYCNNTGYIPLHYTPQQWQAAGGILTDETPVWGWDGEEWLYCIYEEKELRAQLEKELNPDETPEQQRLKKLEKELEERDRREQKRQLEDKLAAKASELGFDPQKARRYSAFGEEAEKYLEQDAQDFKSQIEERYKEEIKKRYGNKAPEAPEEHEENSISRAEYDKMDPAQRSKHLKEGGKVHDE